MFQSCLVKNAKHTTMTVMVLKYDENQNVHHRCVITGLPYGKPSLEMDEGVCSVLFFFFFRVGKSLACLSPGKWYLCA